MSNPEPPAAPPAAEPEGAAAAAVAPLAPPDQVVELTAVEAPGKVAETAAPKMAPQVSAEVVPELDAKVDSFMERARLRRRRSPEFAAQAENVRTMGDADIRKAAETSNRMLQKPVRALKEGGIAQGSKVGKTLLELRRTVEDLDPEPGHRRQEAARHHPVRRQDHRLLPQVPVARRASSTASCTPAQRPGRADQGQRRAQPGEAEPLGGHGPAEPVHLRRRAARREAVGQDRRAGGDRPRAGQGAARRTCSSTSGRSTRTC